MEVHLLKGTISTLREELEEARDNGEDVQAEDEAFLSNNEDYEEEMQFRVEVFDYEIADSGDEDEPMEDEEDPEEVIFESDVETDCDE